MTPMDGSDRVSRFWGKYTEKSKRYGIKPDSLRWYVRHVEFYIKAHEAPLRTHTVEILDEYFQVKGRNSGFKNGRFY